MKKKLLKWIGCISLLIIMFVVFDMVNTYMNRFNFSSFAKECVFAIISLPTLIYFIKLDEKVEKKIDDIFK